MSDETRMREALAGRFRDWIHEQPLSQCDMGADTCPDWDMAYELADLVLAATTPVADPPCQITRAPRNTVALPSVDDLLGDDPPRQPDMSTSGPSDAAIDAMADAMRRSGAPWTFREEADAHAALTAAYEVDEPRIRTEARAEMRDEIVAWLRNAGLTAGSTGEHREMMADTIASRFTDTPDPDKEDA